MKKLSELFEIVKGDIDEYQEGYLDDSIVITKEKLKSWARDKIKEWEEENKLIENKLDELDEKISLVANGKTIDLDEYTKAQEDYYAFKLKGWKRQDKNNAKISAFREEFLEGEMD